MPPFSKSIVTKKNSAKNLSNHARIHPRPPKCPKNKCKKWISYNGDIVYDGEHAKQPCRWRFNSHGKLITFIVYKPDAESPSGLSYLYGLNP